MPRILLNGVSRAERHMVIASATEAIGRAGGWVEDVRFFSNMSVNLLCVAEQGSASSLASELSQVPISFGRDDLASLERLFSEAADQAELRFSLQITFVHDEPDLRDHVPAVPG